jgi:hypothetical protein
MSGVSRYPLLNEFAQFIDAPDPVYGTGVDGTITFDGTSTVLGLTPSSNVYTMTSDIHAYNMTISAGVRIQPNGYRIFVKNILTFGGANAKIGYLSGFSGDGSIKQGADIGFDAVTSLGGSSLIRLAVAPAASVGGTQYYDNPRYAVLGYSITANGLTFLRGGAGSALEAGGGIVIVAARYISPPTSGTAYIQAPANNGAGGGVIIIVSTHAALPTGIVTDVSGYASGTVKYLRAV